MKIVARLIGARNALSVRRQVFFVSLGGFDNHNLLMQDHPRLMERLNDAMSAFYAGHRGAGRGQPGHDVHGLGFRPHAELECRRFGSRLGQRITS